MLLFPIMAGDQGFELSPERQRLHRELHDKGEPVFESIAYYVVMRTITPKTFERWVNDNWAGEFNEGREFTRFSVIEVEEKAAEIRHIVDHLKDTVALRVISGDQAQVITDGILKRIQDNPGLPFDRSTGVLRNIINKLAPSESRGTTDPGNR
jgi:hypothetical protein